MSPLLIYIFVWLVTAFVSALYVRLCISLAPRWGFLDIPLHEAHKRHKAPVPVMGGLGMYLGWLTVLGGGLLAAKFALVLFPADFRPFLAGITSVQSRLFLIMLTGAGAVFLGMCDDRKAMHALPKFGGQFVLAIALVSCGMKCSFVHWIPGANEVLSVLWILTIMNALNFFDNMDGLAAGACAIAAATFLFVAGMRGQHFVAILSALTGGAASGFLFYNRPPARIFMGDGGSHFLGILLAVCGILTTFYIPGENATPAPILIPLCALGVPLFDAVAVVLIRLKLHVPIYKGDNRHISHRFSRLGLTRPQAVALVHLLCLIVGLAGLALLWMPPAGSILIFLLLAAVFSLISILQFFLKNDAPPTETQTK